MNQEAVNHPSHYNQGKIEVIDAIEDWKLGFALGNAVKYIARAGHKGDPIEDLRKAAWYIDREINRLEGMKQMVAATATDRITIEDVAVYPYCKCEKLQTPQ